jgi:hypothetical protein
MALNRPVIVTDALDDWRLDELWTPDYFVPISARRKYRSTTATSI